MKKTDLALIVLIVGISAGVAYVIGNSIFGGMTQEGQKVQTIDPITSNVEDPSDAIFNDNAINPAVEVQVTETNTTGTTKTNTTDSTK